jgi:hypothetical protein
LVRGKPGAGIDVTKLPEREYADGALAIGGSIESGIMEHDWCAVSSKAYVQLESVCSLLHGQLERRQGILRS